MLFLIYGIILGLILQAIHRWTTIPYTPMLLIVGALIGGFADYLWYFGDAKLYVTKLSSHTLLFVFIPPLIFEGAWNIDVRIFLKSFWQILILALPSVALGALLIAVILLYVV